MWIKLLLTELLAVVIKLQDRTDKELSNYWKGAHSAQKQLCLRHQCNKDHAPLHQHSDPHQPITVLTQNACVNFHGFQSISFWLFSKVLHREKSLQVNTRIVRS